jgi:hypothetical protein
MAAATATLASTLICSHEIGIVTASTTSTRRKRERIGTGNVSVDEALDGGVVYGSEGVYNVCGCVGGGVGGVEAVSFLLILFFPSSFLLFSLPFFSVSPCILSLFLPNLSPMPFVGLYIGDWLFFAIREDDDGV